MDPSQQKATAHFLEKPLSQPRKGFFLNRQIEQTTIITATHAHIEDTMTTLVGIRRQLTSLVSLTGRSSTRRPDLASNGRKSFSGLAAPNGNQNSWRSLSYRPLATSRCFSNDSSSATGSFWKNLSPRQLADLEDRISRKAAANIKDPILETNLASLQWIHPRIAVSDDGTFQVLLKLPSLLHPKLDELKQAVKEACVLEIQKWLKTSQTDPIASPPNINVEALGTTPPVPMMARLVEDPDELLQTVGPGLATVAHTVAVYSCKGGVGKSTVAVNLAYELARRGGKVGLVDLDLYGPSLPVLIRPEDVAVRSSPKGPGMVYPIQHEGVSVLSLGFVAQQVRMFSLSLSLLEEASHRSFRRHSLIYHCLFLSNKRAEYQEVERITALL